MVFYDNKKRFSYKTDLTSPGKMRVKVLPFVKTSGMKPNDRRDLRDHCHQLFTDELKKGAEF